MMRAYCITMDDELGRERMKRTAKLLDGLVDWSPVPGLPPPDEPPAWWISKKHPEYDRERRGALGCYLSHQNAANIMLAEGEDYAVFLEDDVEPVPGEFEKALELSRKYAAIYGVFYVGYAIYRRKYLKEFGDGAAMLKPPVGGTQAYVVHRSACEFLMSIKTERAWDKALSTRLHKWKGLCGMRKSAAHQRKGLSAVTGKVEGRGRIQP